MSVATRLGPVDLMLSHLKPILDMSPASVAC
jgi:hypothetical protein